MYYALAVTRCHGCHTKARATPIARAHAMTTTPAAKSNHINANARL
jgi:hypothetical protein